MAYYLGLDIGSGSSKGIIIGDDRAVISHHLLASGASYSTTAASLYAELLRKAVLRTDDIRFCVATGQGAARVTFANTNISDMRCCAKGLYRQQPAARTVVDIEGQSVQVFHLGEAGELADFVTNEKCASASGSFLEIIANVLQIPLEEIGQLSLTSRSPIAFSSACAVFGESEAVSRVAEGVSKEDILAGIHRAMADRISSMIDKIGLRESCAVCGGGALNTGLVKALEEVLKTTLLVPAQPRMVTALGAALMARDAAIAGL
jgi:(R)-2-hydroxyacyl-CoA dehydratese activating ATPase